MQAITIRSALDGFSFIRYDDGHAKGNPKAGGAGRQTIEALLNKKAPDGEPLYYVTEPLRPWRDGKAMFEPIPRAQVWDARADERLAKNLEARAERKRDAADRVRNRIFARERFTLLAAEAAARAADGKADVAMDAADQARAQADASKIDAAAKAQAEADKKADADEKKKAGRGA